MSIARGEESWRGDLRPGDQRTKAWCECGHHVDYHDGKSCHYNAGLPCDCTEFRSGSGEARR